VSIEFVQIKALGSKLAPPQGVIAFPCMYIKNEEKNFFYKTERARALIFGIETLSDECLPSLFK
jgi:hypothetical protein